MYKITKIMTNDGTCFDTEEEARRYLDKRYGEQLSKIVHRILSREKWFELYEFLDSNLDLFKDLIEFKNELEETLEQED